MARESRLTTLQKMCVCVFFGREGGGGRDLFLGLAREKYNQVGRGGFGVWGFRKRNGKGMGGGRDLFCLSDCVYM